eukprot:6458667-Amphidinium_carterae.2
MKRIKSLALDLEVDEEALHQRMAPSVACPQLKGKRVLLFRELLKQAAHPDSGVPHELESGFN